MASTNHPSDQATSSRQADAISAHAEASITEDVILAAARDRADDIGVGAVTPAVGALAEPAGQAQRRQSRRRGRTGAGVSGLWLLSGMSEDGVLTTIDIEPEHQRIAKQAFTEAGIGPSRMRLISGRAQEVLTRLADESYELVFIDADPLDQPSYVVEAVRLLREGTGYHGPAFDGPVFSDDLSSMAAISEHYGVPDAVLHSLQAGVDVALWVTTDEVGAVLDRLEQAVGAGELTTPAVDASLRRVAAIKGTNSHCGG
ncbi:Putative O-methyltransferase [Mycobacterium talmoniae]|uniref:O-methyltransferase n=1 Tax=Mycobacterium talmoniae TaxID=1858794 RepID=A0A2S8BHM1_9MYCO|nr:Putative O-methyltransferase [Mycobacterium talmoniae]